MAAPKDHSGVDTAMVHKVANGVAAAEWGDGLPPKAKATLLKWVANGAPEQA